MVESGFLELIVLQIVQLRVLEIRIGEETFCAIILVPSTI